MTEHDDLESRCIEHIAYDSIGRELRLLKSYLIALENQHKDKLGGGFWVVK